MSNLHPGVFLILAGLITAAVPGKKPRQVLMILFPAAALVCAFSLPMGAAMQFTLPGICTLRYLCLNSDNQLFLYIFAVTGLAGGIFAAHDPSRMGAAASMGYVGSSLGVTLAGDWLTLLLFWELMAVSSLFLILPGEDKRRNPGAGFRYLLVHMLSGNLVLFGAAMKVFSGSTALENLTAGPHDAAFWLLFFGVAINAAVVPFHTWLSDAYPEGTITGSVYLCSFTTKVAVLCMARLFFGFDVLLMLGVLMVLYGAAFSLAENDIRRILSYQIISQVGFMIAACGMDSEEAANAVPSMAYGITYKFLLFMCAGAVMYATGRRKLTELGGLYRKMPLVFVIFLIAALSISDLPLLAGFTCKSWVSLAAEEFGSTAIVWLMAIGNAAAAMAIPCRMGYFLFFGKEYTGEIKPLPLNMKAAMVFGAALCVAGGLYPELYYQFLPYAAEHHAYTLSHVLEYAQILPAVLIVFLLMKSKLVPEDMILLDVDWVLRRPFRFLVSGLSCLCCRLQDIFGRIGRMIYHNLQLFSNNPYRVLKILPLNEVDEGKAGRHYREDAYRWDIGSGMIAIIATIIIAGGIIAFKRGLFHI